MNGHTTLQTGILTLLVTLLTGGITSCSKPFPEGDLLLDVLLEQKATVKYIFITAGGWTGNLGGIAGADAKCNSDLNKPPVGFYAAMLVDGTNRIACGASDANCATNPIDPSWILYPNTDYVDYVSSNIILTTNSNSIVEFGNINFAFGSDTHHWTGLLTGWKLTTDDCLNWTDSTAGNNGAVGHSGSTNVDFIDSLFDFATPSPCNTTDVKLICARVD